MDETDPAKTPQVTSEGALRQTYVLNDDDSNWSADDRAAFHAEIGRLCATGALRPPTIRNQFRDVQYPRQWFDHLVRYHVPTSLENDSTQVDRLGSNAHVSWIRSRDEWNRICWRNRYDALHGVPVTDAKGTVVWPAVYSGRGMFGDRLADWFTEQHRNRAHRDGSYSRHDSWTQRGAKISQDAATWNGGTVSMKTLCKSWFYKSANVHSFALYGTKALYVLVHTYLLNPNLNRNAERRTTDDTFRILDSSTGWGGSALVAMALDRDPTFAGRVAYTGVEPNAPLHDAYREMQSVLDVRAGSATFLCDAFESITPETLRTAHGPFDLIFTSPPFFDHEWYDTVDDTSSSSSKPQSTSYVRQTYARGLSRADALQAWLRNFLYPCIDRWAYSMRDDGGILAVHMDDYAGTHIVDAMYAYIRREHTKLRHIGMVPMFRMAKQTAHVQPVHMWKAHM